jgi:hypothetical protein
MAEAVSESAGKRTDLAFRRRLCDHARNQTL